MTLIFVVSVALQFFCLVHMVRSGRPYWWLWVILVGSFLGCAVYVFTQVLPDLRHDPRARRAVRGIKRAIDPERERKRIEAELEVADTVQNRLRLAHECLALGDPLNAEELFQGCLKGPHANEPDIMLGLARAQFARGDAKAACATLEALIAANPSYRSAEGHLLYARALEGVGEFDKALGEYQVLAEGYPGEEGRARYALLLKRANRLMEAQAVFKQMLARAKVAPRYYQREQREWIELAREQLSA